MIPRKDQQNWFLDWSRKEENQNTNIKHEKGVTTSDPMDIKRIIEYYEHVYASKFINLDEQTPWKIQLLKLTQFQLNSLSKISHTKTFKPRVLLALFQAFKEKGENTLQLLDKSVVILKLDKDLAKKIINQYPSWA